MSDLPIDAPRRAPRLPRIHNVQPQISGVQRFLRAVVVIALLTYAIALRMHHG